MPLYSSRFATTAPWFLLSMWLSPAAGAAEIRGRIDAGLVASSHVERSWRNGGLGKTALQGAGLVGRITLRGDTDLFSDLLAAAVVEADSTAAPIADVQEVWLGWNPVPKGPWRARAKAGAFFPVTSIEVGYDSIGWTPTRTLSNSAINSWLAQEIRIKGVEFALLRRGALIGSPHTFGVTGGIFGGNDPAGTLIAWQGWNIGDRVAGIAQRNLLPDLPVYRADGQIPVQTREVHVFREIDGRAGYYLSLNYAFAGRFELAALHYDNRADPLRIEQRQYGWHTRFDHVSVKVQLGGEWELLAQGLRGDTLMGANAVSVAFSSWYVLVSHPLWKGQITLRQDRFDSRDRDQFPGDANGEEGSSWALAYRVPLGKSIAAIAEGLLIDSDRPSRRLAGSAVHRAERSLNLTLRWGF